MMIDVQGNLHSGCSDSEIHDRCKSIRVTEYNKARDLQLLVSKIDTAKSFSEIADMLNEYHRFASHEAADE